MEKSGKERGAPAPPAPPQQVGAGRVALTATWVLRKKPGGGLEAAPANSQPSSPGIQPPRVPGIPFGAPHSAQVSAEAAHEAVRLARDGARLVHAGRFDEAIALLQRSVRLDPTVAAPHHDLGLALLSVGRIEQAAGPFGAALRLDPRIATAHYCLGYIFDTLGQQARAIEEYQSAVALQPALVEAQMRLGDLYLARGLRAESIAAFRAASRAAEGTVTAQIAEARALEAAGSLTEALAATRAIVGSDPASAEAHAILGRLLGQAGHAAEAAAHYERAAELSPAMSHAWHGVATNRKFTAGDSPLIARMNASLARSGLTPRQRLLLHFALGKAYDDIGDYQAAMRNFEAGNRLRALGGRLRRDALVQHVDRLIAMTPPGYRDRHPDCGVEDATPILIAGMPRSGTTLIEQIVSSHPEVAAGGELQFWGVRAAPAEDLRAIAGAPEATRRVADAYLTALRAFGPNAKRVTDKSIGVVMWLGVIHRVLPNAILIHCRRHPIDTALSIFTTTFERNFEYASDRSDLVFYVRQYQRLMAHWRESAAPGSVDRGRLRGVGRRSAAADEISDRGLRPRLERCVSHASYQCAQNPDGEPLAGAPADLPHLRRPVASLRAVARGVARIAVGLD